MLDYVSHSRISKCGDQKKMELQHKSFSKCLLQENSEIILSHITEFQLSFDFPKSKYGQKCNPTIKSSLMPK